MLHLIHLLKFYLRRTIQAFQDKYICIPLLINISNQVYFISQLIICLLVTMKMDNICLILNVFRLILILSFCFTNLYYSQSFVLKSDLLKNLQTPVDIQVDKSWKIDKISIPNYKEDCKFEKKTILYQIQIEQNNNSVVVERSFREFKALYSDLKFVSKHQKLPEFPRKMEMLTDEDLRQRMQQLEQILQISILNQQNEFYLNRFLNINQYTETYSQQVDKIKKKRKSSIKSRYYVNNSNSMVITKTTGMASEIIKEVHEDEEHSNHSQQQSKNSMSLF